MRETRFRKKNPFLGDDKFNNPISMAKGDEAKLFLSLKKELSDKRGICPNCNKRYTKFQGDREKFVLVFVCDQCMGTETHDDEDTKKKVREMWMIMKNHYGENAGEDGEMGVWMFYDTGDRRDL